MTLPDRVIMALENALDDNLPPEVPGAAVAILTPEGDWFGASGVSDLANDTPLEPDDRFEAGSITKTFVATTILQLVEEGQLSLDDTLTTWLDPTVTDLVPNAADITLKQLLNHTSGITDYLDILSAQAASNPTVFLQEWEAEQLLGFVDGVEPLFAPGTDWQYSNTNYILAGLVIEAVTGNSYGQEIRDRILNPLELENTFVFGEEPIPGGYINSYWDFNGDGALDNLSIVNLSWTGSAGSIISNAEDLADFFDALLVDGELLQPETLDEMLDTIPVNSPNYDSYGLGIGTLESRNRFWYVHRGQTLSFRSNLWYSPLEEITYVELLNGRSSTNLVSDLLPTYRRTITPPTPDIVTYNFDWTGQIAGFSVTGEFSYDASQFFEDDIVREENLESFDISFFDPEGNLLRTYEDNHLTFPEFNFAFDTNTQEILQDGYFLAPDGFNTGEKTPVDDGFSGLNFWSRPEFNSQGQVPPPHLHIDDWADEFGFPIGFSSHEDVAFLTRTTAELIETGRVGDTYVDNPQAGLDELGPRITVSPPPNDPGSFQAVSGVTSLFINFSLLEIVGIAIQNATPTATPFSNQFQLGFEITDSTDFQFDSTPFTPTDGTIEHTGDISFVVRNEALLTIGDFSIGFDAERVSDTTSGFFVADTLEDELGADILFDLSTPGRTLVADEALTIADTDLLLAPELAEVLGLSADFAGTDLGDARIDADLISLLDPPPPTSSGDVQVVAGVTSLSLDTAFFETAGLAFEAATPTAPPFSDQFQFGFEIADSTDFQFDEAPFTPTGGSIEHIGDISFLIGGDALVTIGNFSIGFDGDRVSDTASGFFVSDTLDNALVTDILFDISVPGSLVVENDDLTITDADLLLAPEFADALGLSEAAGTDVGDTRIDAEVVPLLGPPPGEIMGTVDDDMLTGGSGNDRIDGILGNDIYTGGDGADQFVFRLAQGVDTITDFEVGVDQISLGGLTSEGVKFFESSGDTLVLTNSNELLGIVQGVTGLNSSVFA